MKLNKQFLLSIVTVGGLFDIEPLHGAGLLAAEMSVPSMVQRFTSTLARPVVASKLGNRPHSTLQDFQPGFYTQATEDPIFKRLMLDDEVRNSFLSSVLGETIDRSEFLDQALNPMRSFTGLRKLLNSKRIIKLMEEINASSDEFKIVHPKTKHPQPKLQQFIKELSSQYFELLHAFPSLERNTQLDLVCQTDTGIINVEVQVDPQDFWDIRILSHVCGLFNRQFPKGFEWSKLEEDPRGISKVRRAIGVSIFEKPPINPENIQEFLPWYNMSPWRQKELRRHQTLRETNDPTIRKSGLEFFEYNLAALKYLDTKDVLNTGGVELREWLELLGNAHMKTKAEVQSDVTLTPVKKAYQLIESATLPENIRIEYEEAQKKRYQIKHYVEDEKTKSKAEGEIAGQIKLLIRQVKTNKIKLNDIMNDGEIDDVVKEGLKKVFQQNPSFKTN